jgi:TonB family protein
LTVLACILGAGRLWKPAAKWLETLPAAVSFINSTRLGASGRSEKGPSQVSAERPRATSRASIAETAPRAVRIDPAVYTPAARYAGFHGKVFVVVTVDLQGKVKDVRLTAPTAFDLDIAIRAAVPAWRFKPAMRDGKRVEALTVVQVPFR